jgi:hypothetical protein
METTENDKKFTDLLVDTETDWLDATIEIIGHSVVKELPLVRTAVAIIRAKNLLSEKIAYKKLERFFLKYDEVAKDEKSDLLNKLHNDTEAKKEIGEKLVVLIDSYNDFEKPEILAVVFVAYLNDKITLDEFMRMGEGISLVYKGDLKEMLDTNKRIESKFKLHPKLLASGFGTFEGHNDNDVMVLYPAVSLLGKKFIECFK